MKESVSQQRTAAKLRAVVDELWEYTDDSETNAQTGEVTMSLTKEQADHLYRLFWRLGGKYRRGLEEVGWSPRPTTDKP